MAYRLPGSRSSVTPADGCTVEVQDIAAWSIYQTAVGLASAYFAATTPAAEFGALETLYGYFCLEAQPTFEIVDHRGVVPATPSGMMRLPLELGLGIVSEWAEAFVAEPPETAVDKLVPPGPKRDRLNAQLRAVA
jgi:hypothetical protein